DELAKLRDAPVTDRELARAKAYAIGMHAIREQSGSAVLGDVLDAWMFGRSLGELEEYEARVRAVTAAEMQRLAQRYLGESRRVEAVVAGAWKRWWPARPAPPNCRRVAARRRRAATRRRPDAGVQRPCGDRSARDSPMLDTRSIP